MTASRYSAGRRTAAGTTTRHYGVGRATGKAEADELARMALWYQLPERGQATSTDRMLDTVQAIIDGTGTGYEFNKVRDWIKRFPLRAVAARIDPWQDWSPELLTEIAETVLMRGRGVNRTAAEYGTTGETVDAIVAAYRMQLRRLD